MMSQYTQVKRFAREHPLTILYILSLVIGIASLWLVLPSGLRFIFPLFCWGYAVLIFPVLSSGTAMYLFFTEGSWNRKNVAFATKSLIACFLFALLLLLFAPGYVARRAQIAEEEIKRNMMKFENSLSMYRKNHSSYPEDLHQIENLEFTNPFNFTRESIAQGSNILPQEHKISPGQIEYLPIKDPDGQVKGYKLFGGGLWGRPVLLNK